MNKRRNICSYNYYCYCIIIISIVVFINEKWLQNNSHFNLTFMNHHHHPIINAMNGIFDLICERFHLFNRFSTQCTVRKMRLYCAATSNIFSRNFMHEILCVLFISFSQNRIFLFHRFFLHKLFICGTHNDFRLKNEHASTNRHYELYCNRYAPKYSEQ